jgi:crossover junction endodeoxyribonuclease RuvC
MIYMGIDPGFSGAWAMIDDCSRYVNCGDMHNDKKHIDTKKVVYEISQARANADMVVVLEAVHSMPGQGVSSSFKFGMAYGVALSIAERFSCPWQLVTPQRWKKDMKLTSDKKESLSMARQLWPMAPLKRQKDNGRAEALLLAEWFRRQDE